MNKLYQISIRRRTAKADQIGPLMCLRMCVRGRARVLVHERVT